jgi:diaminopimelate epimerase
MIRVATRMIEKMALAEYGTAHIVMGIDPSEPVAKAMMALVKEPMAVVMAVVAVVLVIAATRPRILFYERLLRLTLAIVSGLTAWIMASGWRWPMPPDAK